MTALLMHPNDELFFTDLQKEIIAALYEDVRIIYSKLPLWIELGDFNLKDKALIQKVQIGELSSSGESIYCPVLIECGQSQLASKLTLVCLHKGNFFTDSEIAALKEKPVRQLKVFRLGHVQDEGPHVKSISKSVWCKLHHTAATVE